MKRFALILIAAVLLFCVACAPAGGDRTGETSDSGSGEEMPDFGEEQLTEGEIRYNVVGGRGYLRWHAIPGVTDYTVLRSPTRFGEYIYVDSAGEKTEFLVEDHLYDYYSVTAEVDGETVSLGEPACAFTNTLIVGPNDDMEAVQTKIDETHARLESGSTGQFSSERFAIVFLPGSYPALNVKVGYYTTVSGAGRFPYDVYLGKLSVSLNVLANNNSTCTFWRSAENVSVTSDTTWAVSQATSLRRMQIFGNLALSGSGWSSGGFLADSQISGNINPGTQQQWMTRNTAFTRWTSASSFNYVFSGCEGEIPQGEWSSSGRRSTVLAETERMAEKPFLVYNGESYSVFVPAFRENTAGISWMQDDLESAGELIPLEEFYIANEKTDTASSLNAALAAGKSILFPAGRYLLDAPLRVTKAGTVLLGMGYATLEIADTNTEGALRVADVGGVRIAGFLLDAGKKCATMAEIGEAGKHTSHSSDPVVLSDFFLRIGGVKNVHTETDTALAIHSDDVVGDNFWVWRADHSSGVAWEDTPNGDGSVSYGNPAKTGVLVTGDGVQCYALMVEHFEGYQTDWRGNDGLTVMYQSETPYRVPSQEKWMSHDGTKNGCASYRVADEVETHRAFGIGVYLVNYSGMNLASAMEVPEKEGIVMEHLVTTSFAAQYGASISHVINEYGGEVREGISASYVARYPTE